MATFFDISMPNSGARKNEQESWFPDLSFKERLMCFLACCALGYFIQICSFGALLGLVTFNPTKLAISYSLGNILALIGTGFLIGFQKQFQNMADKDRRNSAIVFILSLVMVFVSAFVFKSRLLVFIFLVIEFCAYVWYTASYIPFARDCIKNCLSSVMSKFGK